MPEIFVCKLGALRSEDRDALRGAGIIVVELDNPADFRLVRAEPEMNAGDILAAALAGLSTSGDDSNYPARRNRAVFVDQLSKAIPARKGANDAEG